MALQQKPLGLILQICLLVVLSNPTGVAGWDFSSLTSSLTSSSSSSRGLRGSQPKEDAFNGFEEDFEIDYNNNNSEDFDADVPQEEQRELHAGHYGGHRSYYGGNYRPAHAYYYPNPGSYGGYYNHYGYNNRRYYGAYNYNYYNNQRSYFNRPASYSFYNQGYDDWYQGSRSNFFV